MKIVQLKDSQAVTTSRLIADKFGKLHKDVLKAINNLECSSHFTERNFAPSSYKDASGRSLSEYTITKDGFTFLAMGFTGKMAAQFKEDYINAFNEMETRLRALLVKSLMIDQITATRLLVATTQLNEYDHLNFIGEYDEIDSTVHVKRFVQLYINEWTRSVFVPADLIKQQYKLYCKARGIAKPYTYYRMSLTIINYCPKIAVTCQLSKDYGFKGLGFLLQQRFLR